jgi:hypothetical protein
MENLFKYKEQIFEIKKNVEKKDASLFLHHIINNNKVIDENTITIVMVSSNRTKQTYFTLNTISKSSYKNIQIIIVDDSDIDPINIDCLKVHHFYIDLIKINRQNKNWHNPLVNYNIGFQFIKGSKIIIQNSEVCHIGDVLSFINNNVYDDNYYVFDVKASLNYETNEQIYVSNIDTTDIYIQDSLFWMWYQSLNNNRNYHFLTCLTSKTFKKISYFSYDCTMGSCYDDNELLLKIISKNINIYNIFHNEYNIGGIHLYHGMSSDNWDKNIENNEYLFNKKKQIYEKTGIYIDVTDNIDEFETKFLYLLQT